MTLHVHRYGTGPRTYLGLHGWNGTHRTFQPLADHLPNDVSLYALDLPGYGESPPPDDWSPNAIGAAIADSLRRADVHDYSIVGNCTGALLGLPLLQIDGSSVREFFFLEPFSFIPWYLRLLLTPVVGRWFYQFSFGTNVGRQMTNASLSNVRSEQTDLMAAFEEAGLEVPYRYLQLFDRLPDPESFAGLPAQKHLVCGGSTFRAVRTSMARWADVWPDARSHVIDEAGHLPIEEAPAAVAELVFRRVPE